ncbi:MAG: hypothetical protein SCARUB_04523 [Candidatus Scalindua rubra]|uniref:Uncharacterized protein n=1 Tax=Candidatus Scalindua rubra TaxID=1872076 RepID=A0A1E3X5Y0_9BACT|nr:MAG: hypothetical protein SCARUB_04523 [Candidatus Scalindua rubra]
MYAEITGLLLLLILGLGLGAWQVEDTSTNGMVLQEFGVYQKNV